MKIAIVCDVLGKPNNGTSLAAYNLIGFLRERGHDVTVVCADPDKKGKDGYVVVPVKNFGPLNLILKANNVTLAKPDKAILERVIQGADVVHILMPFFLGAKASKLAKEAGVPVTASFHAQAENFTAHIACMDNRLINHLTYLGYYKALYRRVDIVHYPTPFIRELFEKEVKTEIPCRVISNGVNDMFFEPPKETPPANEKFTIFCTGRFSKEKAQQTLIKAVALCDFKDNVKICFAGCGPQEKKLKRLAKRKKVDADFRFYAREELPAALQKADLYVHTAVIEIEAISCLEAIACGLVPVICSSPRSATKAFAADERCLFKMGDAHDLAEKIAYFYRNPAQIAAYKETYRTKRDQFRQTECMLRMEQMLADAAALRE